MLLPLLLPITTDSMISDPARGPNIQAHSIVHQNNSSSMLLIVTQDNAN